MLDDRTRDRTRDRIDWSMEGGSIKSRGVYQRIFTYFYVFFAYFGVFPLKKFRACGGAKL
jgi:hypothetical protein